MGNLFKTNKVKCDIGSYIHYWRGIKKVGKTTLFYDLIKEQYGDINKGLLISVGDEIGFQALDGLVYAECPQWSDVVEVIDELVENKADNEFEIIGLDTADELVKIAKEEVKRLHKKAKGTAVEFNACFGGYGAPRDKVVELIDEQLAKIRKAGYGIVIIGHTKIRDIQQKNGDAYQQLTSNLSSDFDGIFANKADIVMTIDVEKEIDENKHINNTTRYMWFRSDGFVDAGGRFSNMPDKVEYGAKNYIEAFEAGVKGAMLTNATDKEISKRKKEEKESRIKKGLEYSENMKNNAIDESKNEELKIAIQSGFTSLDKEKKEEFKKLMAELEIDSFKDVTSIPTKNLEKLAEYFI